jgi:hypothetical protein
METAEKGNLQTKTYKQKLQVQKYCYHGMKLTSRCEATVDAK